MGVEIILYAAIVFGFYMAWSIGANDAANAMGTSVGSGAISFKEAVVIAVVFEFAGALIAGSSVTDTMRKGIIDPLLFNDASVIGSSSGDIIFMLGMLAALVSAAIWIHVAAVLGWPVSTTHSIVGAITGFGLVSVGASYIQWMTLLHIVSSWVVSPITGGLLAFVIFSIIRRFIFNADDPIEAVKKWSPVLLFPVYFVLALVIFYKGMPGIDLKSYGIGTIEIMAITTVFSLVSCGASGKLVRRLKPVEGEDTHSKIKRVEGVFRYLQITTACFVAFAHGSNDVANSIGPLAAIVATFGSDTGEIAANVGVPVWVLLLGGLGIAVGLATYGYKVIETIGTKITDITPSRGFAAEFGAATTILTGSQLGMPISTTHTVVGAVIGVGFARGMNSLDLRIIWSILKSWVYTLPAAAGLTIGFYWLFRFLWNTFMYAL